MDILGLHNDWRANMMELARVRMECVNVAILMRLELSTLLGFYVVAHFSLAIRRRRVE